MNLRTGAVTVLGAIAVFLWLIARLPGMKGSATPSDKTTSDKSVLMAPRAPDTGSTPVLVELFTSEGLLQLPACGCLAPAPGTYPAGSAGRRNRA